jgi:starch synthase
MAAQIRVLFATSEMFPMVKTGGLGDVAAALPPALREIGVDCRVLIPGYPSVLDSVSLKSVVRGLRPLPAVHRPAMIMQGKLDSGVPIYVVRCPSLYERDGGPYQDQGGSDWGDNAERFALLSACAAILANDESPLRWQPNVVHTHDWQSGLTAAYRAFDDRPGARVLASIHNLSFPGDFAGATPDRLGLPDSSFGIDGLEFYGRLSFLKAALYYADHLATVSPTYAHEITTPEYGAGLSGLLAARREALTGITNGIDTHVWNPHQDPHLASNYQVRSIASKADNTAAVRAHFGLRSGSGQPLVGLVSRLTWQKGTDLIAQCAPCWLERGVQLAIIGTGDHALEHRLTDLAKRYPGDIGVHIGYDEPLSHLMEAGLDMFLMPSRFEPCGLNQMYSMRYGTLPLVRATGGLADTVVDESSGPDATGFVFNDASPKSLDETMARALEVWTNTKRWSKLMTNGMKRDFSWTAAAERYKSLYSGLTEQGPR